MVRVKRVLEALGFDVSGEVDLEASELKGLRARVQVLLEQYEDSVSGRRVEHMTVPFQGWGPSESGVPNVDGAAETGEALGNDRQCTRRRADSGNGLGAGLGDFPESLSGHR